MEEEQWKRLEGRSDDDGIMSLLCIIFFSDHPLVNNVCGHLYGVTISVCGGVVGGKYDYVNRIVRFSTTFKGDLLSFPFPL